MTPLITLHRKDGLSVLGEHFTQLTFRRLEDVEGDTGNDMPKLCWCAQEAEDTLVTGWKLVRAPEGLFFTSVELNSAIGRDRYVSLHTEQREISLPTPSPTPCSLYTSPWIQRCPLLSDKVSSSAHCSCFCSLVFQVLICSRYQQHWLLAGRWKNTYLME